ncbi:MAG: carboxypeptidase-like regulatory domain-containing protein [Chitinophagaceae bacterium]|nr:carboxypeptidase-like regulatory domain-containing protein [Chitinophagaceae bacterium]
MNKNRPYIPYSAEDIAQYLAGKLSPEKMHAMEKAALDDPFLAEAMEGFQEVPLESWKPQLISLHQQIRSSGQMAKVVPMRNNGFRRMKMAAAIFVIVAGAALTYVLTRQGNMAKSEESIAQVRSVSERPANESRPDSVSRIQEPAMVADAKQEIKSDLANAPVQNGRTNAWTNTDENVSGNLSVSKPGSVLQGVEQTSTVNQSAPITAVPSAPVQNNNAVASGNMQNADLQNMARKETEIQLKDKLEEQQKTRQNLNRVFAATVVGPDNNPLPFSNISIKSENFGTYADVKGNFRLVSADTLLTIDVRSVGYQPVTYTLRSNQSNRIILSEEEIVSKQKVAKASKMPPRAILRTPALVRDSVVNVEPADGWDKYNTYIANNIELPDELLKKGTHGEIGITFDVKADGSITNVKADRSDCGNCDELAKKLLEQGPQWKVKNGKKGSAKVKVQY